MSPGKKKNPRKGAGLAGVNPTAHQLPHRWKLDYDYLKDLSLADLRWLAEFSDCYYAGDFRSDPDKAWESSERRAVFTSRNAGWADAYARAGPGGALRTLSDDQHELADRIDDQEPARGQDMSYLDTHEYRGALAEYRATLATGRRDVSPKNPHHTEALERLKRTIRELQLKASDDASSEDWY